MLEKILEWQPHLPPFTPGLHPTLLGLCSIDGRYPKLMDIQATRILRFFGDIPAVTMEFMPMTDGFTVSLNRRGTLLF